MKSIVLNEKQLRFVRSRRVTLTFYQSLNWVEDAAANLINSMERGENISVYFKYRYPQSFKLTKTRTGDERRTLLFRIQDMIMCLLKYKTTPDEYQDWRFAGMAGMMKVLICSLEKILGKGPVAEFKTWFDELSLLWSLTGGLNDAETIERELLTAHNTITDIFVRLRAHLEALEIGKTKEEVEKDRHNEIKNKLDDIKESVVSSDKANTKLVKTAEKVLIQKKLSEEEENGFSKYEGLEEFNESQRYELKKAIDFCYASYPIERGSRKKDAHTISKLAAAVWLDNADEFLGLAKLSTAPGYPNAKALASSLHRLAKKYPSAAHFSWA